MPKLWFKYRFLLKGTRCSWLSLCVPRPAQTCLPAVLWASAACLASWPGHPCVDARLPFLWLQRYTHCWCYHVHQSEESPWRHWLWCGALDFSKDTLACTGLIAQGQPADGQHRLTLRDSDDLCTARIGPMDIIASPSAVWRDPLPRCVSTHFKQRLRSEKEPQYKLLAFLPGGLFRLAAVSDVSSDTRQPSVLCFVLAKLRLAQ